MKNILVLSLIAIAGVASAQNLVNNGTFTAASYPANNYEVLSGISDWTIHTSAQGQDVAGTGVGYLGQTEQMIDLSGYPDIYDSTGHSAYIYQGLNTVAGKTYNVQFDVYTGANLGYSGGVDVFIDGVEKETDLQSASNSTLFKTYDFQFVGGNTDTIAFDSNHGTVSQIGNVSVEAVPEPISMVTLGLGVVGLLKRKKK